MARRITLDPRRRARARYEYECTDKSQRQIAADAGIDRSTLAAIAKREGWAPRRRHSAGSPARAAEDTSPADMAAQIQRTVERELAAIDAILAQLAIDEEPSPAAERTARTLASLTRTLKEVQRLRATDVTTDGASQTPTDDDDMPRDIDEFRRELARRIDAFVASRTDARLRDGGEQ